MKFDFMTMPDRAGKDAIAAEVIPFADAEVKPGFDRIPMWVADMNFPTAPAVTRRIIERAAHPLFGYFSPSDEYYNAILSWQARRNGVTDLTKDCIGYENGVLGGVVSAAKLFCPPDGAILLHSPTYIGFTRCLEENGFRLVTSPLVKDGEGVWRMDFADMERRIIENNIRCAVLCSPHNPAGRVWEAEELRRAAGLFEKYDVKIIADEIWSDLVLPGYTHTPFQSVSAYARDNTVALYAPSKTFNLAGLVGSYHIIRSPELRERYARVSAASHYNSMNVLSMHALIGAYSGEGETWLEELLAVLDYNVRFACDYIQKYFPGVSVTRPQGTYMLFLDCSAYCARAGCSLDELLRRGVSVGVIWQDGRPFHGPCHIRMNLALPFPKLREAFARLREYAIIPEE